MSKALKCDSCGRFFMIHKKGSAEDREAPFNVVSVQKLIMNAFGDLCMDSASFDRSVPDNVYHICPRCASKISKMFIKDKDAE